MNSVLAIGSLFSEPISISTFEAETLQPLFINTDSTVDGAILSEVMSNSASVSPTSAATSQKTCSVRTGKENVKPDEPLSKLPPLWTLSKSTDVDPKSCFSKTNQTKKDDPLVESVKTLSSAFVQRIQKEEKNEKNDSQSDIPLEDQFFGKTVAAELARIKDESIKATKKAMIMSAIYSPMPDTKAAPSVDSNTASNADFNITQ